MGERFKKNILPQMFDVRPVNAAGDLDLERVEKVEKVAQITTKRIFPNLSKPIGDVFHDIKNPSYLDKEVTRFQKLLQEEKKQEARNMISKVAVNAEDIENVKNISVEFKGASKLESLSHAPDLKEDAAIQPEIGFGGRPEKKFASYFEKPQERIYAREEQVEFEGEKRKKYKYRSKTTGFKKSLDDLGVGRMFLGFSKVCVALLLVVFGANFVYRGMHLKNESLTRGQDAYANLLKAKDGMARQDFRSASLEFGEAYEKLDEISKDINSMGGILVEATKYLPYVSKLSSGRHLVEAGKDISQIGVLTAQTLDTLNKIKNPLADQDEESISYLEIFKESDENLKKISALLKNVQDDLENVNLDDIPEERRSQFVEIRQKLPYINDTLSGFVAEEKIFTDILGGNGPRKYLFLFQNNQEMRATGGFIGTYAVLDIFNGRIRNFFIDGIFNPDGQLRERVVPPAPIQKISANWSLHDSNWFPDFPKSAEKAAWFYEKTGGPTVDGVITMTPNVMQKLLEITGPIDMPEYEVSINKDNFLEKIQNEVEVDYDKDLNQPKKILADLAPKILDKIFNARNLSDMEKTMKVFSESLNEKHILIYSKNYEIEKVLSQKGWSGEVMDTQKDYLSVINTNINGYKTDGVIEETISHKAEIQNDGSIVDTVEITRRHNGGKTELEWWNKVNADYMRVYVPKGAKLLKVEGQTREFNSPPLDYDALGYKRDAQIKMEEDSMQIDEESGTKIYDDGNKTVFGNWVYVSPQESTMIKYTYILPFRIDTNLTSKPADAYSLLAQKQSGSIGSKFISEVTYPDFYKIAWKYPENESIGINGLDAGRSGYRLESDLKSDKFIGMAFTKK